MVKLVVIFKLVNKQSKLFTGFRKFCLLSIMYSVIVNYKGF